MKAIPVVIKHICVTHSPPRISY